MKDRVEAVLTQYVRPKLREHQGGIEVTRIEDGVVYIRLRGHCATCASAQYTLEELVEKELTCRIPEVREVSVDNVDPELFRIARQLLRHELPFTAPGT